MAIDFEQARIYLQGFDFAILFREILGWENSTGIKANDIKVEETEFKITPIAQLKGVVVFELTAKDGLLPNAKIRAAVHKEISKHHHENLLIFLDKGRTQSLWYWVKREEGHLIPRDHLFVKGQPGDLFLSKLNSMVVDITELDENGDISVLEVVGRLQKALDVRMVTKKFYLEFAALRLEFIGLIQGIDNDHDRHWYASVLLNRMMFIYFLQRKGFINNGDLDYLQNKLVESKKRGMDQYFSEFLPMLFFEGFAKPAEKRSDAAKKMLGEIRYLNGGLFLPHPVEQNPDNKIVIPDRAFENLLQLFSSYSWNLNDTPGGADNEINPDVLGYIFEQYINQKSFGAYYTRPEITEYLCEQTIYRLVLQKVNTPDSPGVFAKHTFSTTEELLINLDAPLCKQLLFDVLPKMSILDPACGSGAFLVAAMKTLINIYSAIIGRIELLSDKELSDWLEKTKKEHPSVSYFIKRRIITDNLFGVDIMEEASEIARLRLFLALVSSVRTVNELEPLPNIDFNILPGNSLIGMLRVNEAAFNQRLGVKSSYKQGSYELNYKQVGLFQQKTYRQIVDEKKNKLEIYRHTSSQTKDLQILRDDINRCRDEDYVNLNDMLVDEFKALEIKYEQATWDEKNNVEGRVKKRAVQIQDIQALHPFHWGYEFDEVMNTRGGFDIIITNPPWDIFKPNGKEFFAGHSSLVTKKKMTIEDFEKEQGRLLQQKDIRDAWFAYKDSFPYVSAYYRSALQFANQISILNGKKVGTDINLYKLFVEQCFNLLRPQGCCGMVLPSGIYTDLGTKQLRELLFEKTSIMGLFCFENRKEIFEGVHRSFKFVVLTFEKGEKTIDFPAMFMRHEVKELSTFPSEHSLRISVPLLHRLSPDSLSVMEFKNDLDVQIAEKMLKYPLLSETVDNKWKLDFTAEFHMTNDSHLFKTQSGIGRLPLFEGKMIWQFEHEYSAPRYWVLEKDGISALVEKKDYKFYRLGFRDVTATTNMRSTIATIIPKNVFAGNTLPVHVPTANKSPSSSELLYITTVFDSFVFDWFIRQKITNHLNFFYIFQMPVPRLSTQDRFFEPIVKRAAKLICITPDFDDLANEVGLGSHKNGVTDPRERMHLRAELDGMIAHLYGLTEEEFAHILFTFPLVAEDVKSAAMDQYRKLAPNPEIMNLIENGETETVEFKPKAFKDPHIGGKNESMILIVFQCIAAFMNTQGGTIFLGVMDDKKIVGINDEYFLANLHKQNWDGYHLNLVDRLLSLSLKNSSTYCKFERITIIDKDICRVIVKPTPDPVYINKQFFVREGPRTRLLIDEEKDDYIAKHWNK